jgi:adenosylmethionine-8-amino-7-oxononanoate aminotransferase
VLLVSDEVITDSTDGAKFGLEHWGVEPDMIQFAKGITSGYFPLGGIGLSDEIAKTIDAADPVWMHAYTYSSHPVGCRVALANLDIIEREGLVGEAKRKGRKLLDGLAVALAAHPHVGEVRGLGMMCAVEIVKDKATKEEFPAADKVGFRCTRKPRSAASTPATGETSSSWRRLSSPPTPRSTGSSRSWGRRFPRCWAGEVPRAPSTVLAWG